MECQVFKDQGLILVKQLNKHKSYVLCLCNNGQLSFTCTHCTIFWDIF